MGRVATARDVLPYARPVVISIALSRHRSQWVGSLCLMSSPTDPAPARATDYAALSAG